MGELPEFLQASLLSGLRLTELQPIDRTWLVRICCDAELPRTAGFVLAVRAQLPA